MQNNQYRVGGVYDANRRRGAARLSGDNVSLAGALLLLSPSNLSVAAAVIVAALAIIEVREPCRGVPSEARD